MYSDLFEDLKKIYKGFLYERDDLLEKKKKINNDNDYQKYDSQIEELTNKMKTINSVLNIFERYFYEQKYGDYFDFNLSGDKDFINQGLKILDIQEKERERIARDLHDSCLQNIAHLIRKSELVSKYIDIDPIQAKMELALTNDYLRNAMQDLRNTIFNLRPMIFDDLGMKDALEKLSDNLKEISDFDVYYNIEELNCNNSLVLMNIYRIIYECAHNAIKHSGGSTLYFEVKKISDNDCMVIISDDGNGFDAEKALSVKDKHFGLNIVKERVELLSGRIVMMENNNEGTTIKAIIPLTDY